MKKTVRAVASGFIIGSLVMSTGLIALETTAHLINIMLDGNKKNKEE